MHKQPIKPRRFKAKKRVKNAVGIEIEIDEDAEGENAFGKVENSREMVFVQRKIRRDGGRSKRKQRTQNQVGASTTMTNLNASSNALFPVTSTVPGNGDIEASALRVDALRKGMANTNSSLITVGGGNQQFSDSTVKFKL